MGISQYLINQWQITQLIRISRCIEKTIGNDDRAKENTGTQCSC